MILQVLCTLSILPFTLLLRTLYLILLKNRHIPQQKSRRRPVRTMIILGSGGHTTEILRVVANMKLERYSPRIYVRACTDVISAEKVKDLEGEATDYQLIDIRRSREVQQSYFTSVWTTLVATLDSIPILWTRRPELILCNGPGTCVPLCLVAFFYKLICIAGVRIVFVESFCRVNTLSLSGKLLYWLADFFVVRWTNFNHSLYRSRSMDTKLCANDFLPSESLFYNVESNSSPEISVHLTPVFSKLWAFVKFNQYTLTRKWIRNTLVTLDACLDRTWESLNTGRWQDVSIDCRHCYSLCAILKSLMLLVQYENNGNELKSDAMKLRTLKAIVLHIDKGILLGAPPPSAPRLLPTIARKLNCAIVELAGDDRPKVQELMRLDSSTVPGVALPGYSPVIRRHRPSMEAFYADIFRPKIPAIAEGCMEHWKALALWNNPEYLLRIAGVRTVPIEIGSRYTEEDWTQRLLTFSDFLQSYIMSNESSKQGYLAQHGLFDQIPELMDDIVIPDYCSFSDTGDDATPADVNAWLGPAGTISPLHFDPKNNLLCQVFGIKQVVLFHPEETANLYPYDTRLLSNTAQVDPVNPDYHKWPKFKEARGVTCTLKPGEMLFIPPRWWHHIVALSPSFSVSFWWH